MHDPALKAAVQNQKLSSKQGLLQRSFARFFDSFVYNQIWEDPRVDVEALELNEASRVLTISSGGCNALHYLLKGPARVTAVDLNRHHIYLLELKTAAIKHLPSYDALFEMFGRGKGKNNGANYLRYIAPNLKPDVRNYWESNSLFGSLLFGDRISYFSNSGIYDHSRNGYFLRFFHRFARILGCRPELVLSARTVEEQRRLCNEHIDPFFDNLLIRSIGKMPVTLFGLGIPPQQFDELKNSIQSGHSVIDTYRDRARRLACDFPIKENYFAWQAFARKYDTENRTALPEYLKEANYERLRENLYRLSTVVGSVTDLIRNGKHGEFDRFVFLDAQDWMNDIQLTELWRAITFSAKPGARIIFRTAGSVSPVESKLPGELRSRFRYHEELSKDLFVQDRSSIYGGFHVYELK